MSLGSFVQGAFRGYSFGEDAQDRKTKRERDKERWEWQQEEQEAWRETRDYTRGVREHADISRDRKEDGWQREDDLRDDLIRINEQGYEDYRAGSGGGNVRTPLAPQGGDGGAPIPDTWSPAVAGIDTPRPDGRGALAYGADVPTGSYRAPLSDLAMPDTIQGGQGNDTLQGGGGTTPAGPGPQMARAPGQPEQPPTFFRGMGEPPMPDETSAPGGRRDAPRGPRRPQTEDEAARTTRTEQGTRAARDGGALTYGGGAQPNTATPDMPFDRRVPAGPEAGMPERQIARNTADIKNGGMSANRPQAAGRAPTAPPMGPEPRFAPLAPSEDVAQSQQGSTDTAIAEVDPSSSAFMQDVQEAARTGDIEQALSKINVGLATGKYGASGSPAARAWGAVTDYFTESPEDGEANAASRRDTSAAQDWFQSDAARALFAARPDLLEAAAADPIGFYAEQSGQSPAQPQVPGAPPAQPGTASAAPAPRQASGAPAAQSAPGASAAPAQDTASGGQAAGTSMRPAVAAQFQQLPSPRMALGDGGAPVGHQRGALVGIANRDKDGRYPKEQIDRGAKNYVEYYNSEVMPKMINAYLKAGDVETARQFQTWMEDDRTKQYQMDVGRAMAAHTLTDEITFEDHFESAFNGIDDGYMFLRDQSSLSKNERGETVATITLRNTDTGEVFTEEYVGGEELYVGLFEHFDAKNTFERLKGKVEARRQAAAKQYQDEVDESWRRIRKTWDNDQDRQVASLDIHKLLMESNFDYTQMSTEEQKIKIAQEMEMLRSLDQPASGAPVPVYTGQ